MSLDSRWWARLAPLALRARARVDGAFAGRHRGRSSGVSGDFVGHRAYTPSDDWRHVDWTVYARTDRWTVRETQADAPLRATLLLDASGSMAFAAEGRRPKIDHAAELLSAIAHVVLRQGDACALGLLGEGLRSFLPPRSGAAARPRLLSLLESPTAAGPADLGRALREVAPRLPRRGLVLLASDFFPALEGWMPVLREWAARGREIIAFQILDPAELSLAGRGVLEFQDLETDHRLAVDVDGVARRFARLAADRQRRLSEAFAALGADFQTFRTDRPLDAALVHFLRQRDARA